MRMSTKKLFAEVVTRVEVGSLAVSGSWRGDLLLDNGKFRSSRRGRSMVPNECRAFQRWKP